MCFEIYIVHMLLIKYACHIRSQSKAPSRNGSGHLTRCFGVAFAEEVAEAALFSMNAEELSMLVA
jgi:hypothetical protein